MLHLSLCILAVAPVGLREPFGPANVTMISGELIERIPHGSDPSKVVDALVKYKAVSQVYGTVTRESVPGPMITLRPGMPTPDIRLDGILVNPPDPLLTLEALEKVEVLTGPASTIYGSSSASSHWHTGNKALSTALAARSHRINPSLDLRANGWTTRGYGFDVYRYEMQYDLQKEIRYPSLNDTTTTTIGTVILPMGDWQVPRLNPLISERYIPDATAFDKGTDDPITYTLGGVSFTDEYKNKLGVGGLTLPWKAYSPKLQYQADFTRYLRDATDQYGSEFTTNIMARSGLGINQIRNMFEGATLRGEDMNSLKFPGNPSLLGDVQCGSEFVIPSGTLFAPDRSGYQLMSSYLSFKHNFLGPIAGIDFHELEQMDVMTHCVNMDMKEPEEGVKYYPYYNPDPVLRGLMDLTERSRFRGPWMQARTWIYTDKASLSDINKRLIPPVSTSRYVNGLFDVASLGGLADSDLSNAKLFDPSLLASPFAENNSFAWFAATMSQKHAKAMRAWMERVPKELSDLVSSGEAEDMEHLTRLFSVMFLAADGDTRMGALGFLTKLRTSTTSIKGKVGVPYASLASSDNKEVELALECVEKFCDPMPKASLSVLSKHGKTDAIKKKAAELAGR